MDNNYAYMGPMVLQAKGLSEVSSAEASFHPSFGHDQIKSFTQYEGAIPLTRLDVLVNHRNQSKAQMCSLKGEAMPAFMTGMMTHTAAQHISALQAKAQNLFKTTMESPDLTQQQRLENLAEIHFLLAHAMPDERGSAAKTEMVVRSMALALDMELPPTKPGKVLDLEAFMQIKADFKAGYAAQFEWANDAVSKPLKAGA